MARYHWRFDPEINKYRLFDPGEQIPSQKGKDKAYKPLQGIQITPHRDMDKYNTGLGVQQRHVKEKVRQLAGETGKVVEEIGNDRPDITSKAKPHTVTREQVQHIKDTVE